MKKQIKFLIDLLEKIEEIKSKFRNVKITIEQDEKNEDEYVVIRFNFDFGTQSYNAFELFYLYQLEDNVEGIIEETFYSIAKIEATALKIENN